MWRQGWRQKPGTFLRPRQTPYDTLIFRHFWNLALHSHCSHLPNVFRNSFTDCLETRFYYVSLFQITSAFFPSHDMYKVSPNATGEHSHSWSLQICLHIGKFTHITFLTHIVFLAIFPLPAACALKIESSQGQCSWSSGKSNGAHFQRLGSSSGPRMAAGRTGTQLDILELYRKSHRKSHVAGRFSVSPSLYRSLRITVSVSREKWLSQIPRMPWWSRCS